ncbi:hypothetical protein D3C75_793010 [compost metagenome]
MLIAADAVCSALEEAALEAGALFFDDTEFFVVFVVPFALPEPELFFDDPPDAAGFVVVVLFLGAAVVVVCTGLAGVDAFFDAK